MGGLERIRPAKTAGMAGRNRGVLRNKTIDVPNGQGVMAIDHQKEYKSVPNNLNFPAGLDVPGSWQIRYC